MKKIPQRKCLGCMESKPKNKLYRLVKTKMNEVIIDTTGKLEGRGAYICSEECLEKARRAKRFEKEFEMKIDEEVYESIRRVIKGE